MTTPSGIFLWLLAVSFSTMAASILAVSGKKVEKREEKDE